MKKIYKSLIAAAVVSPFLSSCVEEVFPTSGVTEDQLQGSPKAVEAKIWGMPGVLNEFGIVTSSWAFDWGFGSMMHVRDVMTEQYAVQYSGYDWYLYWEADRYQGENYSYSQIMWYTYTRAVLAANDAINSIPVDEDTEDFMLGYLGMAHAYRAMLYLDLARMYEFLPNDKTVGTASDGQSLVSLVNYTVPIVTEKTTEAESRNNPRVKRDEMFKFILGDLQTAEEYIANVARPSKTLPDLACVYGLYARLYLWMGNDGTNSYPQYYALAADYANKAYTQHGGAGTITTEDEWLSTTQGFNMLSTPSWMWGGQLEPENAAVQTGILNWTSWVSNETYYGYASAGPFVMMNALTYENMSNTDFRKLSWKAPEGSRLYGKSPVIDEEWADELPPYASFKFRPGDGNMDDYNVGSSTAYPFMRVEEMYLIEAEAVAWTDPGAGLDLLKNFMKYRDPNYYTNAASVEQVVAEIYKQKSIELWGEGQTFFDTKRLNVSVTRSYEGTNFISVCALNTSGRPAWMNLVFPISEVSNNKGLDGWNNPDPSRLYEANYDPSEGE